MTAATTLATEDGRDRAIRDRCAAFMAEASVAPSGFGWADEPFRWLAHSGPFYAYAPTADGAMSELASVVSEREEQER